MEAIDNGDLHIGKIADTIQMIIELRLSNSKKNERMISQMKKKEME